MCLTCSPSAQWAQWAPARPRAMLTVYAVRPCPRPCDCPSVRASVAPFCRLSVWFPLAARCHYQSQWQFQQQVQFPPPLPTAAAPLSVYSTNSLQLVPVQLLRWNAPHDVAYFAARLSIVNAENINDARQIARVEEVGKEREGEWGRERQR